MESDLIVRLRGWGRRYGPRSPERRLFNEAADRLAELEAGIEAEVASRMQGGITIEAIEKALGGNLLPWQRERMEKRDTPPSSTAA